MDQDRPAEIIGRASATERAANTSEEFRFWLRPDVRVNPFDIVEAEHGERSRTFGLINSIEHSTDASSHLSNYISNDFGIATDDPNTPRQGTNVARAAVLSNEAEDYMPVQAESRIRFASVEGIHRALGIDSMQEKEEREQRAIRIPAGLIRMSNGAHAVAYLDADYVVGPEAGHVNVSGISGLATKTSYIAFLVQSILQTLDASRVATVFLNVKFNDLLRIDEARTDVAQAELDQWTALGLRAEPFRNVHYILPAREDGTTPNVFGTNIPQNHQLYGYSFNDAYDKLDLLFADVDDEADTLASIIGEIAKGKGQNEARWQRVQTWDDLLNGAPLTANGQAVALGNIKVQSVGRFLRLLRRAVRTQHSGLFVRQRPRDMTTIAEELGNIQGGHTYVVDVARLMAHEQAFVFGDVLKAIYELYASAERDDLPDKVLVFVDELNKYAPAHARPQKSPILAQILDIAERGRSFGIILLSAEQFLSAVHSRVTGNAATKLLGRTDSAELGDSAYRFLDPNLKGFLTRVAKGELLLSHPIYRQPVKISFPRPAFRQGR